MKPLLYLYVFFHTIWATIEGSLEQQGQSSYAELSHEAWEFMAGVDASVWNTNTDTMQLYMHLNGVERAGIPLYSHPVGDREPQTAGGGGCGGGLSFAASTQVATAQGKRAIGTLRVGEQVWAYNPKTHAMELQAIVQVWLNHDNDLVDLTLAVQTRVQYSTLTPRISEVIHTNKKHPFLTVEQGFLPVAQITVGMHVERADGSVGVVTGRLLVSGTQTMYNLEVAHDHTFTVGNEQWIVHNCDAADWIKQLPKDPQELLDQGWRDVTDPRLAASPSNRIELEDPTTGRKVSFEPGKPGEPGWEGKDHYHVYNPGSTNARNRYLDRDGNVVRKGADSSHIEP